MPWLVITSHVIYSVQRAMKHDFNKVHIGSAGRINLEDHNLDSVYYNKGRKAQMCCKRPPYCHNAIYLCFVYY